MTAEQYVNAIVRKIKCDSKKKKEIKKQLQQDIDLRVEQGEKLEDVISQMGTVQEIADSFNESISVEEQKKFVRNRIIIIAVPTILVVAALVCLAYFMLPEESNNDEDTHVEEETGIYDKNTGAYFDKTEVESALKETVELLDAGEYAVLQENAALLMRKYVTAEEIENAKKQLSDDWGERREFGEIYITEMIQQDVHYAIGEMMVTYDNVTVVYTITYDENMQLAGLYMR